ncbi:SusD/RagB family nutrient-binding outer membrane lipoprotein [Flavobacterium agricola]|uniref:SusD/RagB family nutrient-binding outer membrane lipoprotein n=1 Tax=Flavobacterium agricola TaxID=2870839 RepID=A0ABY6M349_9FLAO|nr:SusD/RagB family nutrient-binding outer membrane lipoprotein [Flavobacterium agricola]UYW01388.1 SusD/RagB family nutrient-binding outer membrane lipoprotein [Flavobacterium agricola]
MKIIKYTLLAFLSLSLFSCTEGFEEDNTNPNNPLTVPTYGIYNNATKQIVGTTIRGSFGTARMALPWVQYSAQRNYTEEDRYQYRDGTAVSIFNAYYQQANNFKKIIELNTDPETVVASAVYGNNDIQVAASRIFLAYIFQNLADTFGDVPYWSYGNSNPDFQALDIDNLSPKYAKQEDIYADLLKELEESVAQIDANSDVPYIFIKKEAYTGENVFGNDVQKLRKFANSLRLRIATRLKNSPLSGLAQQHISELAANPGDLMQSNDDSAGVTYENNSINPAPNYIAFFVDNRNDYTVSNTFVSLLKGTLPNSGLTVVDPRLQQVVAPVGTILRDALSRSYNPVYSTSIDTINKYYKGMPFGIPSGLTGSQRPSASPYSQSILKADYTEYFMTYAEVKFLLAEANGWNQTDYEQGVQASLDQWGVESTAAAAYMASLPAASEESVLNQKYIALFMQPYEAWAEYRRTGFPKFLVKPGDVVQLIAPAPVGNTTVTEYTFEPTPSAISINGAFTDLPSRVRYPYTEATLNRVNYEEAVARLGGDTMNNKLIWDNN